MVNYQNSIIYRIYDYKNRYEFFGVTTVRLRNALNYQIRQGKIKEFNRIKWNVRIERVLKIPCTNKDAQTTIFTNFLNNLRLKNNS